VYKVNDDIIESLKDSYDRDICSRVKEFSDDFQKKTLKMNSGTVSLLVTQTKKNCPS